MSALGDACLATSPPHYYPLTETSGMTAFDLGTIPVNGTYTGSIALASVACPAGDPGASGCRGDGSAAYVTLAPPTDMHTGAWSITYWCKSFTAYGSQDADFFHMSTDASLHFYGRARGLTWYHTDGGSICGAAMDYKDWSLITATCSGHGDDTVTFMVNGRTILQWPGMHNHSSIAATYVRLFAAHDGGGTYSPCDDAACHLMIHDRQISEAEHRSVWEAGIGYSLPGTDYDTAMLATSGLSCYLPLNDGVGATAADASGHSADGTYHNLGNIAFSGPDGSGLPGSASTSGGVFTSEDGSGGMASGYLTFPRLSDAATSGAFIAWVWRTTNKGTPMLWCDPMRLDETGGGFAYYPLNGGGTGSDYAPGSYIDYDTSVFNSDPTLAPLFMVVSQFDASGTQTFVNGALRGWTKEAHGVDTGHTRNNFAFVYDNSNYNHGRITSLAILDGAILTPAEIYTLWRRGVTAWTGGVIPPDDSAAATVGLSLAAYGTAVAGPVPAPSPPAALITLRVDLGTRPVHVPVRFPTVATVRDPRQSSRLEIK